MSKYKDKKCDKINNKNSSDNSDPNIKLFTSEFLKAVKPFSPTIEIIGLVFKIIAPRQVMLKKSQKESTVFKFVIKNDNNDKIQIITWGDDIKRIIDEIKIGSIIHIDGCYSKKIDQKDSKYNHGTVPVELLIQSNTKLVTLGFRTMSEEEINETDTYPLVDLENCIQYLDQKIRLRVYIKTNFDIITNQSTNTHSCCGSLVNEHRWKIEARILNFEVPFANKFIKGQHVEVIGTIDNSYRYATIQIESLSDIMKIDDNVMTLFELIEANNEIIVDPHDNIKTKKSKIE